MIEVECVDHAVPERSRRFYGDLLGLRTSEHTHGELETANLTPSPAR